jgi:hypothetical protein
MCIFKASCRDENGVYCRKHAPEGALEMEGSRPRESASQPVAITAIYQEILKCIERRLQFCEPNEANCIAMFHGLKQEDRHIVIRRATKLSGSKNDVERITGLLGIALEEFKQIDGQERLPIENRNYRIEDIRGTVVPQNVVDDLFYEPANFLTFPDVDISITNCSPRYLKASRTTFSRITQKDFVIYMGPRRAVKTETGELLPAEDSEWYIPLPPEYPTREIHNKFMVEKIIEQIAGNRAEKEKYLSLRGKLLLCTCLPSCCHCEVYVEVVRALLPK